MTRKSLFGQILLINFLVIALLPLSARAIGQITDPITVDNALRGQEIDDIISILNTEAAPITAKLSSVDDIAGWVNFYELNDTATSITEVDIEPKARKSLTVRITIPEDAANGEYHGYISVQQAANQNDTATDTLTMMEQRIDREVKITVTDQENIDFTADIIPDTYDIKLGEPFRFSVLYDNKGNVEIKPAVQIKISQNENVFYNAIIPYPENIEGVKPLKSKTVPAIEVPVSREVVLGNVRATFNIMLNNETVKNSTLLFAVSENGDAGIGDTTGGNPLAKSWFYAIIILILALAAAVYFIIFRNKNKAGNTKFELRGLKDKGQNLNQNTKKRQNGDKNGKTNSAKKGKNMKNGIKKNSKNGNGNGKSK